MKLGKSSAALVCSALFPFAGYADHFNYNYVQFSATSAELDTDVGNMESDRYEVLWSHDLGDRYWEFPAALYVELGLGVEQVEEVGNASLDSNDLEVQSASAYVGIHQPVPIVPNLDYFAGVGVTARFFEDSHNNVFAKDFFDDQKLHNYKLGGGLRYKPLSYLEVFGSLFYTDFDTADFFTGVDDDVVVDLGVMFHPNNAFAISIEYSTGFDDVVDDLTLTLRYKR